MEKFVLQGRKLNGPPAAREVYATLKQHQLEDEYVAHTHTYLLIVLSQDLTWFGQLCLSSVCTR